MIGFQTRILGIIFSLCLVASPGDALAQNSGAAGTAPGLRSPAHTASARADGDFGVDPAAGTPGSVIPLTIQLPAAFNSGAAVKGAYTFLMFKGLPEGFILNAGFQTRNTWIVSVGDIRDLKMTVPSTYQGAFDADVYLYRGQNVPPHQSALNVRISKNNDTLQTSTGYANNPVLPPGKPASALPAREKRQLSKEEETELFAQGEAQLQNGNVVFARLLFEELVSHGNVRGLYNLARTYDPAVLSELGAVGIQGDAVKANELYRKAAEFAGTPAPGTGGGRGH